MWLDHGCTRAPSLCQLHEWGLSISKIAAPYSSEGWSARQWFYKGSLSATPPSISIHLVALSHAASSVGPSCLKLTSNKGTGASQSFGSPMLLYAPHRQRSGPPTTSLSLDSLQAVAGLSQKVSLRRWLHLFAYHRQNLGLRQWPRAASAHRRIVRFALQLSGAVSPNRDCASVRS